VQSAEFAPKVRHSQLPAERWPLPPFEQTWPMLSVLHEELPAQAVQTPLTQAARPGELLCGQSLSVLHPQAPVPRHTGVVPPLVPEHCEVVWHATQLDPVLPALLQIGVVLVGDVSHAALLAQPQAPDARQDGVAPVQVLGFDEHPTQVSVVVLQTGVVPVQAVVLPALHCTQVWVAVLQTFPAGLPLQSVFVWHCSQVLVAVLQTGVAVGQSPFSRHPTHW
jgi:hypothetical protein